jgi:hypothetical protein
MAKANQNLEDLEKQKLEIEIEILKETLEKEKKSRDSKLNLGEIIRKNTAIILAIISVAGGLFGIILPVNQYFEEKRKEMLPVLNNEIISLVDKLNDPNEIVQEEATVMLTYYGLNAIPVLLLRLERSAIEAETNRLIQAINSIHDEGNPGVLDEIFSSFMVEFKRNYQKTDMDEIPYFYRIYNYKELLINMELSRKEIKKLQKLIDKFEVEIPKSKNTEFIDFLTTDMNEVCNHFSIDSLKLAQTTIQ